MPAADAARGLDHRRPDAEPSALAQICGQRSERRSRRARLAAAGSAVVQPHDVHLHAAAIPKSTAASSTTRWTPRSSRSRFTTMPKTPSCCATAKARAAVGKAAHARRDQIHEPVRHEPRRPLNFLPEPPTNLRAIARYERLNRARVGRAREHSAAAERRRTMSSIARPMAMASAIRFPVGNVTSYTVTDLSAGHGFLFSRGGGECRRRIHAVGSRRLPRLSSSGAPRVLFVNAFDRFDRTTNLRQDVAPAKLGPAGQQRRHRARVAALDQRLRLRRAARQGHRHAAWLSTRARTKQSPTIRCS